MPRVNPCLSCTYSLNSFWRSGRPRAVSKSNFLYLPHDRPMNPIDGVEERKTLIREVAD